MKRFSSDLKTQFFKLLLSHQHARYITSCLTWTPSCKQRNSHPSYPVECWQQSRGESWDPESIFSLYVCAWTCKYVVTPLLVFLSSRHQRRRSWPRSGCGHVQRISSPTRRCLIGWSWTENLLTNECWGNKELVVWTCNLSNERAQLALKIQARKPNVDLLEVWNQCQRHTNDTGELVKLMEILLNESWSLISSTCVVIRSMLSSFCSAGSPHRRTYQEDWKNWILIWWRKRRERSNHRLPRISSMLPGSWCTAASHTDSKTQRHSADVHTSRAANSHSYETRINGYVYVLW